MRKRHFSIIGLCVIAPFAVLLVAYAWVLTRAHLELGGSQPNQQILGRALNAGQSAMDQTCTGIVTTKQSVWLVGRRGSEYEQASLQDAVNLDSMLPAGSKPDAYDNGISQISRLGKDGAFHTMAYIRGKACLLPSADKTRLLLLTGARTPDNQEDLQTQTVVFGADDQGKNWQILRSGFMAAAESLAWTMSPYFHGSSEVWAAGRERFFYSSDQGAHAYAVESTAQLWEAPQGTLPPAPGAPRDIAAHIVQFSDQQATVWVSQGYWDSASVPQTFTREAQLTRHDGHWQVGEIRTTPGLYLYEVKDNGAGRLIAELRRSESSGNELAELALHGHSWNKLGDLPNPFWPLPASTMIRPNQQTNFYASGQIVLLTITSRHKTAQLSLLGSGKPPEIEGNGVFFSSDNGSHWKKLAIPGYLGVLGFNPDKKQVYWSKGNWFETDDRNIYSSELSH